HPRRHRRRCREARARAAPPRAGEARALRREGPTYRRLTSGVGPMGSSSQRRTQKMAKVAFVLGADFEDSEFKVPYDRIREAGHKVTVVGTETKEVKGKKGKEKFTPEATPKDVSADQFDAVVIPGGYSPDHLRTDDGIVSLVQKINGADKPVAAICHAGSLLIEADAVNGKRVTSWPSIRTDL